MKDHKPSLPSPPPPQDMVKTRKSSCQIYGYDFLVDDQLGVWLLEVNSSPTMEQSTAITTKLCAEVQVRP